MNFQPSYTMPTRGAQPRVRRHLAMLAERFAMIRGHDDERAAERMRGA
jgi:hypothetical protein